MKHIDQIEKHLPDKRKALLHSLREHNWKVVGVDDAESDWALDEKWLIESKRENKGVGLTLWMFRFDGIHDGMNRVVETPRDVAEPSAYSGTPAIEFDARKFDRQLDCFMDALHEYRMSGTLAAQDVNEKKK